jgi:hypothetical protein
MAYDAARQRVVMSGGNGVGQFLRDTWEWDGVVWIRQDTATSPPLLREHAMAYDAARQRIVMFEGSPGSSADTWLHGNLVPATTQTIGSACAGTSGLPVIASSVPVVGNQTFVLDLLSARAQAPCLFVLATGTQALNLGGGCTLYLNGAFLPVLTATNASGFASARFAIPPDPVLRGGAAYAQSLVFDPVAFAGIALSAGLKLVLGD